MPNVVSISSPEKCWSDREDHNSRSQPDGIILRCDTTCGSKITTFRTKCRNRCSRNAINVLVGQCFASSSETESVGMSTSDSVVGKGEWG